MLIAIIRIEFDAFGREFCFYCDWLLVLALIFWLSLLLTLFLEPFFILEVFFGLMSGIIGLTATFILKAMLVFCLRLESQLLA